MSSTPHVPHTVNIHIIPLVRCSAIWQCIIQFPGFVLSKSISTYSPLGISTVSFRTRLSFFCPFFSRTKKRCPWKWMGCCIGWWLSGSLNSLIFTTSPRAKFQSISMFSFPVCLSISFRWVLSVVDAAFISAIPSDRSTTSGSSVNPPGKVSNHHV